ncbi:MAG: trigger factor [Burkholderia sp.]|nr:trigger factor [Burkholderia sp.]
MVTNIIENIGKLNRRVEISLSKEVIQKEVDLRIKELTKTIRISGFRLGRAPIKIIENRYSDQIKEEVINNMIRQEFLKISCSENIRVAGQPRFTLKQEVNADESYTFDVTFEVYPDVKIGNLMTIEIEHSTTTIDHKEIDRTLDILRKQRVQYQARVEQFNGCTADTGAQNKDRLTVDFDRNIEDVSFQFSATKNFVFVLGERETIPELEQAALGMKVGEVTEFDIKLPDDYHHKHIAGKIIKFIMTIKKIESPYFPEIDADFAKSLGIKNGDLMEMRSYIKEGLECEAKRRVRSILKKRALDALLKISELDVPNILIEQEKQRLIEVTRQNLTKRGAINVKNISIPVEIFSEQAEGRVKLAIAVDEFVKLNELEAKPEQIREQINELAKNHKDQKKAVHFFYSNQQRLSEIKAFIIENNVVDFILSKAKVTHKKVSFETLASESEKIGSLFQ